MRIMDECPTPVVMVSSLTRAGADATITALELGAVDFIAKPVHGGIASVHGVIDELREKVKNAARARVRRRLPGVPQPIAVPAAAAGPYGFRWLEKVVVIGSSTGGPQALRAVLTSFPPDTGVPILVVQHMPPGFTRALADRLNEAGPLKVAEARPGSKVEPGVALMAPGGFHMAVNRKGEMELEPGAVGVRRAPRRQRAHGVRGRRLRVRDHRRHPHRHGPRRHARRRPDQGSRGG